MIRNVVQKGSKLLETKCEEVKNISEVKDIIKDLKDTIKDLKTKHQFSRGIGLSAPQIGKLVRVSVVEDEKANQYTLINPEIIEESDKKNIREGCISFFEYRANVLRYYYVKIKALDENGNVFFLEGRKNFAMLLQHEIDHLDGILYVNYLANKEKDLFKI